ncbi:MAG: AmmeMemoRadiSam system protein B [Nanoarchaeota archaeon]
MTRKPIVAGQFYSDYPHKLEEQIKDSFLSEFGPGKLPKKEKDKEIIGAISPHAGYPYSGPCAAWTYKEIAEAKLPDLYIMIGLSHSGFPTCISLEDWETPLGLVKTDKKFGKKLIEKGIEQDEGAHNNEHSIEVQIPFLQFINKNISDRLKIMPMIASPDKNYKDTAKIIAETIKELKMKVIVIASSDFTHFGMNYGFFPFKENIKKKLYDMDKGAIENINKLDPKNFLHYIEKTGATICGQYPIAVTLELCKLMGAKRADLLKYYTSGDIVDDYGSAVGYASIVIR